MINVLIVEDEIILARDLKGKLENLGYHVTGIAMTGYEAIQFANKNIPDVAIMDIDLQGEMDGFDVGSYFKKTYQLPVIYLTQFKDLETFEKAKRIKADSYLTKPVNIWDLVRAIELSISRNSLVQNSNDGEYLLQKAFYLRSTDHSFEKVPLKDILYLKASGAYTEIYTLKKKFTFSENMSFFERKLVAPQLLRVHRSWIINLDGVERIEDGMLVVNETKIPVGKTYKKNVMVHFQII